MKAFLENLADEIRSLAGDKTDRICIVLPNRRAGLFLKHYLSKSYQKSIWAPEIYSIEDFFVKFSGHLLIDQAGLIFELYQVYLELNPKDPQDFETFSSWGQVLLSDFNELDLYLADPRKVFGDISDTRALTVWNLGERPLTPFEENYIHFYQSLLNYYQLLKERLISAGNVYKGLAHRIVAENIEEISKGFGWDKILFAGLNALSKSEEEVIQFLLERNKAAVYWDADRYYLDDPYQEAGHFIRDYLKKFQQEGAKWVAEHFKGEKDILITGVPGYTGQATYAGKLLQEIRPKDGTPLHHTAIVMAEEKLLLPMLNSLPEGIESFNITMGYSLKLTPVYHFFHILLRMHQGSERIKARRNRKENLFYARDVLNLLRSPYLNIFGPAANESISRLIKKIRNSGRVTYTSEDLIKELSGLAVEAITVCKSVFGHWKDTGTALTSIQDILEDLKNIIASRENHDILEMEYFYHFARITRRVKDLLVRYTFIDSLKSLEKVLFQMMGTYSLPFYGEPLEGLQMMGVLETRAIDFDQLIILSVNEGVLPSGRMQPSFIPYDIKSEYDLPTHREKDAIFAYHFYRLLQRAKTIHLVYETEGTQIGGGEKSRFITQLLYEMPRYNPKIKITEQVLNLSPVSGKDQQRISFEMSPGVRRKLLQKAEKGFYPSGLSTFIQCPLKFYFQEIAGIREAEEVEETIEVKTLGNVIHHSLHQLFVEYKGRSIAAGDIKLLEPRVDETVQKAYELKYPEGELAQGKNLLIFEVSKLMVKKFLKQQRDELETLSSQGDILSILELEDTISTVETIDFEGGQLAVTIKGKVDRIDKIGDQYRVIDYKTGTVKPYDLKLSNWDDLMLDPKFGKAFQLILYAYIYSRDREIDPALIQSGNISLKTPSAGFIPVQFPQRSDAEAMDIFQGQLGSLLGQIFDPSAEFTQTEDVDQCKYCSFKGICNR